MTCARAGLLAAIAVAATLGVVCIRARELIRLERRLRETRTDATPFRIPSMRPPGWEGLISGVAQERGGPRLLAVAASESQGRPMVQIEWQSDPAGAYRFLARLQSRNVVGAIREFQATPAEENDQRYRASFEAPDAAARASSPEPAAIPPALRKPVFDRVVRAQQVVPDPRAEEKARRAQEEARRLEAARQAELQREKDEIRRRDDARRALENGFSVTGIVHDGREAVAFIAPRHGRGAARLVRMGDRIEGARVVAIDEELGEVRLDQDGLFQVTWTLP